MDEADPEAERRVAEKQESYMAAMDSTMRVFLAGFGGALTGLSLSRQRPRAKHVSEALATAQRRARVYGDSNLPAAWAMACMGFAGIIEATRLVSPMSFFLSDENRHLRTVGDYTIGGATAGAAFRGMQVRSARLARTKAPTLTPTVLSGLFPGIMLGLLAGIFLTTSNYVEELAEAEKQKEAATTESKINES
mmetsp:Transcript_23665/g.40140  ORF Transcript_23665/g.40140 Transcript_23665/m.40140 type:complete len:193 (+) Transcript_23665:3-581(+)